MKSYDEAIKTWGGKPYHSLDFELKKRFGTKVYKISLDAGMTCPNRDGTAGTGGCIFCSEGGSGDFAVRNHNGLDEQIESAKAFVKNKIKSENPSYIAYFQSFTNTYASVERLRKIFIPVVERPDICGLSIATRPDCLADDVLNFLSEISRIKPLWVELGLQTIHEKTAKYINRGYDLSVYDKALRDLQEIGIETVVHVILGLPGERKSKMLQTVKYVGESGAAGIKLQLLHILENTRLAEIYANEAFPIMSLDEYIEVVIECVAILPENMVIHRLTGDGNKKTLIAPKWSADKKRVLNTLTRCFNEKQIFQGCKNANKIAC